MTPHPGPAEPCSPCAMSVSRKLSAEPPSCQGRFAACSLLVLGSAGAGAGARAAPADAVDRTRGPNTPTVCWLARSTNKLLEIAGNPAAARRELAPPLREDAPLGRPRAILHRPITIAVFRRTHRHRRARRRRPSRFWTTARRATLAEIVAAENRRTATAALMRPRPRLARGLCRSRVHRQLRTSPRVAGQMQRGPFGTPRVPKRLYFYLNSCQYGSFERQLGPAGFLPAPLCLF